jgi:hypothetical protein
MKRISRSVVFLCLAMTLTVFLFVASAGAQCLTCAGDPLTGNPPPTCAYSGDSGWASCIVYAGDPWCRLSGACGGGGGGGDPCAAWTQPIRVPGQSVATLALLFESDAATNAHLFGGRGHSLRVVSGGAFGSVTPDGVAQQIRSLSGDRAGLLGLAAAFANFNNAGIAVSLGHGTDGGIEFAPVADGAGTRFEVHFKGARHIGNAIDSANLMPEDLLLLDVTIQGKAYVLAVSAKTLNLQSPSVKTESSEIIRSFTQSVRSYPIRVLCPCRIC